MCRVHEKMLYYPFNNTKIKINTNITAKVLNHEKNKHTSTEITRIKNPLQESARDKKFDSLKK